MTEAKDMQLIEDAFNEYHSKTCVRFKPRMGEKDYISIESSQSGCWSSVGRIGGKQEVNLQMPGCTTKVGTIVHELMHALGFLHEQNRSERDNWVTIMTQNIQRGTENNFAKASAKTTTAFGVQYDYGSVMHYSTNAFSANGKPTIVAKVSWIPLLFFFMRFWFVILCVFGLFVFFFIVTLTEKLLRKHRPKGRVQFA